MVQSNNTPPPTLPLDIDSVKVEERWIKRHLNDSNCSLSLGEKIQSGTSLLTLSNLVTPEEIDYVVQASLEAAEANANRQTDDQDTEEQDRQVYTRTPYLVNQGHVYTRMPVQNAAKRHDATDALPEPLSQKLEEIFERALSFIDDQLCPSLRETLFGADVESLAELFRTDQIDFSLREPAINVYRAPSGHFGMHKDDKDLTILIPLSDPSSDFTGGGTAFWSQKHPQQGQHDPSLTLIPAAGTGILFGGRVSHKGMHIHSGTRVVFVTSFSRLRREGEEKE